MHANDRNAPPSPSILRHMLFVLGFIVVLSLGACVAAPAGAPTGGGEETTTAGDTGQGGDDASDYEAIAPLAASQALTPTRLSIPNAALDVPVEAMGWTVVEEGGQRTTQWVVPDGAAGWHVNSAGAGGVGNLVLSGHQRQGDAVFAPLSLGDVAVGQRLWIEDSAGVIFVYEIVDVSDPIAVTGVGEAETQAALAYVAPSEDARVTLITGWPDFTTTHRVFAQAELLGVRQ